MGGRMGGRTVGHAQLSHALWGWSPLSKARVVLQEEHSGSVHGPVVHLIPGKTVSQGHPVGEGRAGARAEQPRYLLQTCWLPERYSCS